MKTIEDYFTDWESHVFGYGYGTGEEHLLGALAAFFQWCEGDSGRYDYTNLERGLGPCATWLLINALCHADIIEYGTSPRFGWLTHDKGQPLRDFVLSKTVDELVALANRDEEYSECYPDHCNCLAMGESEECSNPFWTRRK